MGKAPAHTRITFSGVFGSATVPTEIWSFNVNTAPLATPTAANATGIAGNIAANAWTVLLGMYSSDVVLTKVRVAAVDGTGHVIHAADGSYQQGDALVARAGTLASPAAVMPLQTALCVSLSTARPGVTGKGRFFLPWPRYGALGADYRLDAGTQTTYLNNIKQFLQGIVTQTTVPIVVASGGSAKTGAAPVLSTVTGVRVGRVPDTMRSRRGALQEAYAQTTI